MADEDENGTGQAEETAPPAQTPHVGVAQTRSEPAVDENGEPAWTKELREQNRRIIELLEKNQPPEKAEPDDSDAPLVVETPPLPAKTEAEKRKKSKSVPARRFGRGSKS